MRNITRGNTGSVRIATLVILAIILVAVIVNVILVSIDYAQNTRLTHCRIDTSPSCDDGNSCTVDFRCTENSEGREICDSKNELNGVVCEEKCLANSTGSCRAGVCEGECGGVCTSIFDPFSPECPDIDYDDIVDFYDSFQFKFCFFGGCISVVEWDSSFLPEYPCRHELGDMVLFDSGDRCKDFISDNDPFKECYKSFILCNNDTDPPSALCLFEFNCFRYNLLQTEISPSSPSPLATLTDSMKTRIKDYNDNNKQHLKTKTLTKDNSVEDKTLSDNVEEDITKHGDDIEANNSKGINNINKDKLNKKDKVKVSQKTHTDSKNLDDPKKAEEFIKNYYNRQKDEQKRSLTKDTWATSQDVNSVSQDDVPIVSQDVLNEQIFEMNIEQGGFGLAEFLFEKLAEHKNR